MRVISLELNELNFHYIKLFSAEGRLPTFSKLLRERDLVQTDAGEVYPQLEPWIQWPTVYTGKTYAEHQLFRLGDIVYREQPQIWDYLEAHGLTVGAISPMNASNRCSKPKFFLPDPWTHTKIVAEPRVERLFTLLGRIVNDNAASEGSVASFAKQILPLALPFLQYRSIDNYLRILPAAVRYKWAKAAFLDQLLADLFVFLWRRHKPGFASLFLNAGAHIQHHHTYDSRAYGGEKLNPMWYSKAARTGADPLLFIYEVYDRILKDFLSLADAHVFITTGLSQVPNDRDHYQYRIVDFEGFFGRLGLKAATIRPRMSRDFLLEFPNDEAAQAALPELNSVRIADRPLFAIEASGSTLFCQVAYFGPPDGLKNISIAKNEADLSRAFTLVSIENAIHQAAGYHVDTAAPKGGPCRIALTEVYGRLCTAALAHAGTPIRDAA